MDSENSRFKEARLALKLTLQELSLKTGYSVATISGVENGHDKPSKRLRDILIQKLLINEEWLKTGKGKMLVSSESDAWFEAHMQDIWSPEENAILADPAGAAFFRRLRELEPLERQRWMRALDRMLKEFPPKRLRKK